MRWEGTGEESQVGEERTGKRGGKLRGITNIGRYTHTDIWSLTHVACTVNWGTF